MDINEAVRRSIERVRRVHEGISEKEDLGIRSVIFAIVKEFPAFNPEVDIYEAVLGSGSAISFGAKDGRHGKPLFVITKRDSAANSFAIRFRLEDKNDQVTLLEAWGWPGGHEDWNNFRNSADVRFELSGLAEDDSKFRTLLQFLKVRAPELVRRRMRWGGRDHNSSLVNDIIAINSRKDISPTERDVLAQARIGQGWFREKVLEIWKGGCAVTGTTLAPVLRASHIRAWAECVDDDHEQRLDPYNGLPLVATLDALFDKHLISFSDDGKMLVSKKYVLQIEEVLQQLSTRDLRGGLLKEEHKGYLRFHREIFMRMAM